MKYPIVSVLFPFAENPHSHKRRPALCLTKPQGKYHIIVVCYITTKVQSLTEVDLILNSSDSDFENTGLLYSSAIVLHKLSSIPMSMIEGEIGIFPERLIPILKKKLKNMFELSAK